jgi:hypothetical protein
MVVYPSPPPQGITQSGDTLFANPGAQTYQWYQDGNIIPGATEYFYVAQSSGSFNVVATDVNGCEVEAVIFDVVAGVASIKNDVVEVKLFPNPAGDHVTVSCKHSVIHRAEVYNALGEKIIDANS